MVEAWRLNMVENFVSGYVNCLDESMSVWTNKFTCPGFMFVPCKPWLFGNEYHTVCCCTSGIMWGIDLVEGKDCHDLLGNRNSTTWAPQLDCCFGCLPPYSTRVTEFRQPLQVQSHLEMPGILVQLGHIQRT